MDNDTTIATKAKYTESDIVDFAIWIRKNYYYYGDKLKLWMSENDDVLYTHKELINVWEKQR